MQIYGFQKSTLLDYPNHLACTIFTSSCNFRCPFCHNASLVLQPQNFITIEESEVFNYLKKRSDILEGVCITGGEPTLQPNLIPFIKKIKQLSYQVKLDTNGYRPDILQQLLAENLVDYIAMDIKNSPQNYGKTCGLSTFDFTRVEQSVDLLKNSTIPHEFRTTVVKEYHTIEDMIAISSWLPPSSLYFIQSYEESPDILIKGLHSHTKDTLITFLQVTQQKLPLAKLRGIAYEN